MKFTKGDRVVGGRANWTARGTVSGVRDEADFEPDEERTVFVKWDGATFSEEEMGESEVRPE